MSYIAGFFDWTGRSAPEENRSLLDRMGSVLAHRGQDGIATVARRKAGATVGGHSWGGQELSRFRLDGREMMVAWDGRLRNRAGLRRALGAPRASVGKLIALGLRECGPSFLGELEGEFAFALSDGESLWLGRDPTGLRPLFYCRDGERVRYASEIKSLLRDSRLPHQPNRGMVADLLLGFITRRDDTFFENVFRLRPGCVLQVSSKGDIRLDPYHPIALADVKPLPSDIRDEEIRERVREALTESVRACVERPLPAGLLLSSGLDSTSILSVTKEAFRRVKREHEDLKPLSWWFETIEASNERPVIEETCRAYGLSSHFLRADDLWSLRNVAEAPRVRMDEPTRGQLLDALESSLTRAARDRGATVVLNGHGADQVWTGNLWALRVLRDRGEESRLRRELAALPERMQGAARFVLQPEAGPFSEPRSCPPFDELPPEMWEIHRERFRRDDSPSPDGFPDLGAWGAYCSATSFEVQALAEIVRGTGLEFGVEYAFPFLDPRFVELIVSIPSDRRFLDGNMKQLARLVLEGAAPPEVLERRVKVNLDGLVDRGLETREKNTVRELLACEVPVDLGLLTPGFREAVRSGYRRDRDAYRTLLLQVLAVSLWSRHWFG